MGIPLWKVLPGLVTRFDQMFAVAQFGAATTAIRAATVNGDAQTGVQFVGQCQGMISDVPSVEDLVERILDEAATAHREQAAMHNDESSSLGREARTAV
jgi:enoyl-[acyl-carrier protein] reductase II